MPPATPPSLSPAAYRQWLGAARRYARVPEEARDLLQEALVIAFEAGRLDLSSETNRRWFTGVLRRRGAFDARTAARRRQRERTAAPVPEPAAPTLPAPDGSEGLRLLAAFPPAARAVLALALHGLAPAEICAALEITPTAFRQRLTTLRRVLGTLPDAVQCEALALAYHRRKAPAAASDAAGPGDDDVLAFGLIRRALLHAFRQTNEIGTHDPDGHLVVLVRR